MSDFRYIPLKKPYEVDIVKPLTNVLSIIGSTSKKKNDFTNQIHEFSKLRSTALWNAYDRRDGALENIYTYFDQLNTLEKKIPAGELQIPFKWKDAFSKSLFLTKTTLTISSVSYEKICVLFNIAALQSFIGSNLSVDDDEGLKQAAKLFQLSAGIFDHLKNNVVTSLQREPTPDLHPDTLAVLTSLMLAQAQEVFVHKSRREQIKHELIAKIANDTSVLYEDAFKAIQLSHTKDLWGKETIPTISGKHAMFRGVAEFYQASDCKANNSTGEQISWLKLSIESLKKALKFSSKLSKANELIAIAEPMLKEAVKENDCIFHDKVPDCNSLSPIGRASLVKHQPLPQKFSVDFKDIFVDLIPITVQRVLNLFETRKQETVQAEIFQLREATQLLNGILASLNLPAAIEDTLEQDIPQSIVTKSTTVQNLGGALTISRVLDGLTGLQTRNTEILEEIERALNDEESTDNQLREEFKERWTRKNSSSLTSSFRTNLEKYRRTITTATHADISITRKFEEHKAYIEILGNGPAAMTQAVPQATVEETTNETKAASRLKQLMKEVEAIKTGRDVIEGELKSLNEDIKDTFCSAVDKGGFNEDTIVEEELKRIYSPIQQMVKDSLAAQERLIEDIKQTNNLFAAEKKDKNIAAQERDKVLKKLAVAYDVFMDLSNNLDEGTKFYNDLAEVLLLFQSKVVDFCFARRTEKDELLRDLEKESGPSYGATNSKENNAHYLTRNRSQHLLGATAASARGPELPYPTIPQHMPLPYGSYLQLPYPQFFMPPVPNVYYMPLPSDYHHPNPNQNTNHLTDQKLPDKQA